MHWFNVWKQGQHAYAEQRQRLSDLQSQYEALKHMDATSTQLMSTVSHALRTPMNAILGFTHLLQARQKHNPEALELLKGMHRSADHLLTVINDVLDDAALQTGALSVEMETFVLRDTLHTAYSLFSPRASQMGLQYTYEVAPEVPIWVLGDRHRLMQILVNLLGNAFKFTSQGQIGLQVEMGTDGVKFCVADTGIGIAESQHARIFERFEQADADTQLRYGGHGLGLSISERLVARMGGRMGLESREGHGSQFWFTLPLTTADPITEDIAVPTTTDGESPRDYCFLVVDDHAINRVLLTQLLTSRWKNSHVLAAEDGLHGLRLLETHKVDVVLMDMVMPGLDGVETTRALRQLEQSSHTPVLGLTANIDQDDLAKFTSAGVNAVVLKPFEAAALFEQVELLLKEKKSFQDS